MSSNNTQQDAFTAHAEELLLGAKERLVRHLKELHVPVVGRFNHLEEVRNALRQQLIVQ